MKVYKLTDENGDSGHGHTETHWEIGVVHTAEGGGPLCTDKWLHAYSTPFQASLMKTAHDVNHTNARLWECKAEGVQSNGTKVGCTQIEVLREVELPEISTERRVECAIRCAMFVCDDPAWRRWAKGWLDGSDRSQAAAEAVAEVAARASARAAVWAEAAVAEAAARAGAEVAAEVAARAAVWAEAREAAREAARAAAWPAWPAAVARASARAAEAAAVWAEAAVAEAEDIGTITRGE
jgi:hypothetical protein